MDIAQSQAIVLSLANGRDPMTGDVFPPEHVCNSPLVVRALYDAMEALSIAERAARRNANKPAKQGAPWPEDEDRKLLAAFDAGRSLQEMANAHERRISAIRARLLKYGRLT